MKRTSSDLVLIPFSTPKHTIQNYKQSEKQIMSGYFKNNLNISNYQQIATSIRSFSAQNNAFYVKVSKLPLQQKNFTQKNELKHHKKAIQLKAQKLVDQNSQNFDSQLYQQVLQQTQKIQEKQFKSKSSSQQQHRNSKQHNTISTIGSEINVSIHTSNTRLKNKQIYEKRRQEQNPAYQLQQELVMQKKLNTCNFYHTNLTTQEDQISNRREKAILRIKYRNETMINKYQKIPSQIAYQTENVDINFANRRFFSKLDSIV